MYRCGACSMTPNFKETPEKPVEFETVVNDEVIRFCSYKCYEYYTSEKVLPVFRREYFTAIVNDEEFIKCRVVPV